jgi:hypothetical protein
MTLTAEQPIVQALVQTIRANLTLKAAVDGLHESVAPKGTTYPFLTYDMVSAVYDDDMSGRIIRASFDVWAWARDQVQASDIDQMVFATLENSLGTVSGQSVMYCRRTEGLRITEIDESGNRIYRRGGTYLIWTQQTFA